MPSMLGVLPGRVTYVIDRTGTVRHIFNSMINVGKHVSEALEVVRHLQAEQPALLPDHYRWDAGATAKDSPDFVERA